MNIQKAEYDVIIIGSGLGGLLCASILAKEGMHVCVLEKNRSFGGCLQTFKRNGVTFDTGVHYFGSMDPGQTLHSYWSYFGLTDSVKMERMNPDGFDRIIIGDREYPMAMGFEHFTERLLPFFPGEKESLKRYVSALSTITGEFPLYNLTTSGHHKELHYRSLGAYDFLRDLILHNRTAPHEVRSGKRLLSVLTGNSFLYCGDTVTTPVHIPALINHSYISSAWRPVGGSDQIASHLVRNIREKGGELVSSREVAKIRLDDKIFRLETTESETFTASRVVSGISPVKTLELLDPSLVRQSTARRFSMMKHTPGAFSLYLRLKENSFRQLDHNCYLHKEEGGWTKTERPDWPAECILYTPPDEAGSEFARSMVIMTLMNFEDVRKWEHTVTGHRGPDYLEFKERQAGLVLQLAEIKFPELRSCIAGMDTSTPLTWLDFTGTPEGSMYGIRKECMRPLETTVMPGTKIPNLYFTGQNTNLHGVLGVTIGAVVTCGEMIGLEMLMKKIRNVG